MALLLALLETEDSAQIKPGHKQKYEGWIDRPPGGTPRRPERQKLALASFYHILYELVEMPKVLEPRSLGKILEKLVKSQAVDPHDVDDLRKDLTKATLDALGDLYKASNYP